MNSHFIRGLSKLYIIQEMVYQHCFFLSKRYCFSDCLNLCFEVIAFKWEGREFQTTEPQYLKLCFARVVRIGGG